MSLHVDWCSHQAAKYAVMHWHYSKSMPTPPTMKLGVWEHDLFMGCVVFSRGAASNANKQYTVGKQEIAELTRVALKDGHESTVSRILAIAVRALRAQCPKLRVLVSYSDLDQEHVGTIYQASNWVYVGWTKGGDYYTDAKGKRWHSRMLSKSGVAKVYGKYRSVHKPEDLTRHKTAGRYKYLYPLDAAMREQIAPLSKPYPKRAVSIDSDAPGDQSGEGGVIPTAALQGATNG